MSRYVQFSKEPQKSSINQCSRTPNKRVGNNKKTYINSVLTDFHMRILLRLAIRKRLAIRNNSVLFLIASSDLTYIFMKYLLLTRLRQCQGFIKMTLIHKIIKFYLTNFIDIEGKIVASTNPFKRLCMYSPKTSWLRERMKYTRYLYLSFPFFLNWLSSSKLLKCYSFCFTVHVLYIEN